MDFFVWLVWFDLGFFVCLFVCCFFVCLFVCSAAKTIYIYIIIDMKMLDVRNAVAVE